MALTPKLLQQGAGGGGPKNYIDDVFSTYLYTGNGSTQTITNNIDLSTKGGLVWTKSRSNAQNNYLADTVASQYLISNTTSGSQGSAFQGSNDITSATTTGYTLGPSSSTVVNSSGQTQVSWTFREQPKFFDIVTWTGSSDAATSIGKGIVPHNLGSAPGCVIIKNTTSGSTNWIVYHRSLSGGYRILLNTADAQTNAGSVSYFSKYTDGVGWAQTDPDANNIYVGYNYQTNEIGSTMVAYLFAHNAGGFGLTGNDNVISCGSFTTDGSGNATVSLGYEPQWLLIKSVTFGGWWITDIVRGMSIATGDNVKALFASSSQAEANANQARPNATGFTVGPSGNLATSDTFIYMAIRRPMKPPTVGTSVYNAIVRNGTGAIASVTGVGFPPDLAITKNRTAGYDVAWVDKVRGRLPILTSSQAATEVTDTTTAVTSFDADGFTLGDNNVGTLGGGHNFSASHSFVNWFFKRAGGFFDIVHYTGNYAGNPQISHSLGVAPELIIAKVRSTSGAWYINSPLLGTTFQLAFNGSSKSAGSTYTLTSTYFQNPDINYPTGEKFIAYLFASCPGVSKIGSYTGTATTNQINCGFTGGARFVVIKRTDSSGDWHVWDTVRGIISGNDPYVFFNAADVEVTNTDYIDSYSPGFELSSTAPAALNANGGTYFFLAIA
jgi:hypothetical protein